MRDKDEWISSPQMQAAPTFLEQKKMINPGVNNKDQRGSVLVMAVVLAFSMFLLGLAYLG